MARLRRSPSRAQSVSIYAEDDNGPEAGRRVQQPHPPLRSPSASSDKENFSSTGAASLSRARGKNSMDSSSRSVAEGRTSKRRRLEDRDADMIESQTSTMTPDEEEEAASLRAHSPQVAPLGILQRKDEARRAVRENMRNLARDFNEQRDQIIASHDVGTLATMVERSNEQLLQVKHTEDATLDSAHLVNIADSTLKIAKRGGDTSAGVDIDDFVSKCISFMRRGGPIATTSTHSQNAPPTSTQRRRTQSHHRSNPNDEQDEDDIGESLDWESFGRLACLPTNKRPILPTFLLGPLSVQRKTRQPTQRTQRTARNAVAPGSPSSRPQQLRAEDLQQADNASAPAMVKKVKEYLARHLESGIAAVEAAYSSAAADADAGGGEADAEAVAKKVLRERRLRRSEDGREAGVPFFEFVINPRSFSQTVENCFYFSCMVRENLVGVTRDEDGLPMIYQVEKQTFEEKQKTVRRQEIMTLDMGQWEEMVRLLDLREPMIPHRESLEQGMGTAKWYA